MVESNLGEVADHIPYGSENKIPFTYIDWVGRDTLGMRTVGGKEFNFCNKSFGVNGIDLTCWKPQILNLQPLDTFLTHAHEVHSNFFVLKDFWDANDEFQAHAHYPRKDEFSHGRSPIFSEESEDTLCWTIP